MVLIKSEKKTTLGSSKTLRSFRKEVLQNKFASKQFRPEASIISVGCSHYLHWNIGEPFRMWELQRTSITGFENICDSSGLFCGLSSVFRISRGKEFFLEIGNIPHKFQRTPRFRCQIPDLNDISGEVRKS